MRRFCLIALLFAAPLQAQPFKMEPAAKSPEDSLKCIQVRPGFKVELMVAEPLVMSPIAFAWGPDGKFWVVEMGDYPLGVDGKGKGGGKIKYLEKTKPDGPYDKMTLFMDGLPFPTGVFPYDKGVLVTCAPDIFYAEVGRNGKAANKKVLFTGFREGNQQHRVNGLTWGIDNWIYGANGDSGGIIEEVQANSLLPRNWRKPGVNISGRDFRFKVETREFEAVSGQSQFGRCRDDWGNWFGNNNSNPMYHYVLEDRYLKRNPHVLYPDVKVTVPIIPGAQPVYPISKPLPRFNSPDALNHFTSACSTIIYRDNLFGKDFEGNMFVSEPVHNLVHREIVKPKGVTFTSQRADDEKKSEFLASSDNWFRPTMIQVGPDGALWIADMYRYVIEHPEWIPKDWQKKLDLRAGQDKGRIYRIYPADKKPHDIPRMDGMKIEALMTELLNPSGWVRDTAHQLLLHRLSRKMDLIERDRAKTALATFFNEGSPPQAALHALYIHEYAFATLDVTRKMLIHSHPAIRKHAIAIMGEYGFNGVNPKLLNDLAWDRTAQVRQQLAYSVGTSNHAVPLLAKMFAENASNPHVMAAALSSVDKKNWQPISTELMKMEPIPTPLIAPMLRLAKAYGDPLDAAKLFVRQLGTQDKKPTMKQLNQMADVLNELRKTDVSLRDIAKTAPVESTDRLLATHEFAADIVKNPKELPRDRAAAIRILDRGVADDKADRKLLIGLLTPQTPDEVQAAAIEQLTQTDDARVPGLLLSHWKSFSPALRNQTLDAIFARPTWTKLAVEAIKAKTLPPQEIDAIRRQKLLQHKNADIRAAAAKIFASATNKDRGTVVDLYWLQMPAKTDAARGAKLFAKSCATCHQLAGVGQNVGPDLASVGDKSPQGLLVAILDPNRAVESRYINYQATTKAGVSYNGILASETSTTITLISADGKTHQLLRNELEELASTGKSLMPEGLERDLTPQDIGDIIEYVRTIGAKKN